MDIQVVRKLPQGVVVRVPESLVSEYGGRVTLTFADWKAASRAFSKALRRIERAKLNDHYGTCPLTPAVVKDGKVVGGLDPVYQSKAKAWLDSKPKTYKVFGKL